MIHRTRTDGSYVPAGDWVSLDGEAWIPVDPDVSDEQALAFLEDYESIWFTRRMLASWGAPLEVERQTLSQGELREIVQGLQAQGDQE